MSKSQIATGGIADDAVTTAKTSYSAFPFRNLIINGDMSIAQRGTSVSGKTADGYYTTDRWNHSINLGTWSIDQATDVPTGQGFAKSHKMTCTAGGSTSAGTQTYFHTRLEGQNLQMLKKGTSNAESLTLSFFAKSATTTGTMCVELFDTDNSRQISKQISLTTSWTKYTITYDADTTGTLNNDNGASLYIIFWVSAGSNFTSGTLSETWTSNTNANRAVGQTNFAVTNTELYFTGVQLEVGTSASDFEFLPVDVNLMRCYRYCVDLIKGNQEDGAANEPICNGRIDNADQFAGILVLPTEMRANPSLIVNDISGSFYVGAGGNGGTISTLSSGESLRRTIEVAKSSMGLSLSAGDGAVLLTANSNSILRAEAEL